MKNKFILLAALLLVLPVRGCKKEILAPSVIEFDCRSSSTERKLPNLPNIRMLADRCEDYVFNIEKLSEAIHIFAQEYSQDSAPPTYSSTNMSDTKITSAFSIVLVLF